MDEIIKRRWEFWTLRSLSSDPFVCMHTKLPFMGSDICTAGIGTMSCLPQCLSTPGFNGKPPTCLGVLPELGVLSGEHWKQQWLFHLPNKIVADISGRCGARIQPWAPVPAQPFLNHTNNYCNGRWPPVRRKPSCSWKEYRQREILQGVSKCTFPSGVWSAITTAKNIILAAWKPVFPCE